MCDRKDQQCRKSGHVSAQTSRHTAEGERTVVVCFRRAGINLEFLFRLCEPGGEGLRGQPVHNN